MLASQRGVIQASFGKLPAAEEKAKQVFESSAEKWARSLSEIRPLLVTEEGKQLAGQLESELAAWRSVFAEIHQLAAAGNPDAARKTALEKALPIYESAAKDAQRIQEINKGWREKARLAAPDWTA